MPHGYLWDKLGKFTDYCIPTNCQIVLNGGKKEERNPTLIRTHTAALVKLYTEIFKEFQYIAYH